MRRKGRFVSSILIISLFSLCLSACGGSGSYDKGLYVNTEAMEAPMSYNGAYDSFGYEESYGSDYYEEETSSANKFNDSARKLIKTYNIDVETEDFDGFLNALDERISSLGGYVQDLNTYNGSQYSSYSPTRNSSMTVRIPSANLEAFVNYVGSNSNVTTKNLSVEDVTLNYVDAEARKDTYVIEQERLLSLLEQAENVDDMITIESRLSEVRYKLETQASLLRTYDNLIDYSTVNLYISEVKKYTAPEPVSYGQRVVLSFTNGLDNVWEGLKDFFVDFVGALPGLTVFAIFVLIVVLIWKAVSKGYKKRKLKKTEKEAESKMAAAKNIAKMKAEDNAKDI